jgi:hypothetical protein
MGKIGSQCVKYVGGCFGDIEARRGHALSRFKEEGGGFSGHCFEDIYMNLVTGWQWDGYL